MGQESCVDTVTQIPAFRHRVGVGAWSLCATCLGAKKRIFETWSHPHQYLLAWRTWETKTAFGPILHSFAHFKACSVPIWPVHIPLSTHRKPTADITVFTQKNGKWEFNPSLLSRGHKSPSSQDSLRALPALRGSPRGTSSEMCSAVVSSLPTQLIYHPGRTDLPWKHPLLPVPRNWCSSDWTGLSTSGNTDIWASPLSAAGISHCSQQSLRGNSAQPEADAFGWMMSLQHWFLPHPHFSAHAGLIWPVVLGLSPLAQCCILGATAHHLWNQQKCVMQMNYAECYILWPEIAYSSRPCQLQMYSGGADSLCYPLPLPQACWMCGSCLTLPVGSRKD